MSSKEGFEIVLGVPEEHWEEYGENYGVTSEYLSSVINDVKEIAQSSDEIYFESGAMGRGAEGTALILIFSLLPIIQAGKIIEEGIEGIESWIRLLRRAKNVFEKLRNRGQMFLSEPAAATQALLYVIEQHEEIKKIETVSILTFPVGSEYFRKDFGEFFRVNPERYYVLTYKINDESVHVVCLKSTGDLLHHEVFSLSNWLRFYDIE